MKLKVTFEKEIEIPNITISNLKDLSDDCLEKILREIKEQIKGYFND